MDLTNILEALSGLPLNVDFMSFDDVLEHGFPEDTRVVINAGEADTAWSGGDAWKNAELIAALTKYVGEGGGLIGVNEPTAVRENGKFFQLCEVFGIDRDLGTKKCLRKYHFETETDSFVLKDTPHPEEFMKALGGIYIRQPGVQVLAEKDHLPLITANRFKKGRAMYLSSFRVSPEAIRMLLRAILYVSGNEEGIGMYCCDNLYTECAYYPEISRLVVINNSGEEQTAGIRTEEGEVSVTLKPFETVIR